jgi:hypothetical protein
MKKFIILTALALAAPAHAADSACESVLKANEASLHAKTWAKMVVVNVSGKEPFKMEVRKVDGQYYSMVGGQWIKQAPAFGAAVADFVAKARSGETKISNCKNEGAKVVDGVDTVAISFTVEMKGAPPTRGTVMIGKADGLPYAETADTAQTSYRYKNVTAPAMK